MFAHWLAGCLIFLFGGRYFGLDVGRWYLFIGVLFAMLPDLFSLKFQYNRWSHKHRDGFAHTLFFPPIIFIIVLQLTSLEFALMAGLATLSHPIIDLYGIGWGLKLFYPFSETTYKLFYKGKIICKFTQKEVDAEAEKYGKDNWIYEIYFTWNLVGFYEWLCLFIFLGIFFSF